MPTAHDPDPFRLARFVDAQQPVYERVLAELKAGYKRSHWMWFIFPQFQGLGGSSTARFYAIGSLAEAQAYLAHEILGPRLRECARLVAQSTTATADEFFGFSDVLKLCSSMTLFRAADPSEAAFAAVLDRYYGGQPDAKSIELIERTASR